MNKYITLILQYTALHFVLLVFQILFGHFISIGSVLPDFVFIGIVLVALRIGQIEATIFGFSVGLVLDLYVSGVVGYGALAKTLGGFTAGFFYDEETALESIRKYRFVFVILFSSFVHNLVYMISYVIDLNVSFLQIFLLYGLGGCAYTTLLSIIPVLILSRIDSRIKVS